MAKKVLSLDEKLLSLEKESFDFTHLTELYYYCVDQRRPWDAKYEVGKMILQGTYLDNAMLQGDMTQSQFYTTDFVKKNLTLAIAESLLPDINIQLVNSRGELNDAQDILEMETNHKIDFERVVRDLDQILTCQKFLGFGAGKTYWSEESFEDDWWTGSPRHKPIASNKIFYISKDNLATKKDIIRIYHREQYTINEFKIKYPDLYDIYQDGIAQTSAEDLKNNYYYNMGIVNIVICQYEKKFKVKERAIINEDSGNMLFLSEEEYEEYLINKGATPESMDRMKKIGQSPDENMVFEEAFNATDVLDRTETRWYQAMFIPETDQMIGEIEMSPLKVRSEYIILPGEWDPEDIYPSSEAYSNKDLLKISGILLSSLVLDTVKLMKPIPVIVKGALDNEADFVQNFYKIGVRAMVNKKWQQENPSKKAVYWLDPPKTGAMQTMLFQMVEGMLDKNMSTPNSSRGIPDYAGQSGSAIEQLQSQAKIGVKPDYFSVEEYARQVTDNFKDMIAYKRTYAHKVYLGIGNNINGLTEGDGRKLSINVNTTPENTLIDVARKCFAKVKVDNNNDQKVARKDNEYKELFASGNIPFKEFVVNQSWVTAPESLIDSHATAQSDSAVAEFINGNPQLKEQIIGMMQQNPELEGEAPQNV